MIIKGNLDLGNSNIESLGKLIEVNGYLYLSNCKNLKDLESLEIVGNLFLRNCENIKSLGNLKRVNGSLSLKNSGITREYIIKEKPFLLDKSFW